MLMKLTKFQKRVRDYYHNFYKKNGVCPTYSLASKDLDMSTAWIHKHISILEEKWYITKTPTWAILIHDKEIKEIMILWTVSCWYWKNTSDIQIHEYEQSWERIEIPTSMLEQGKSWFWLLAEWDSMIGKWIFSGDYLIIQSQNNANTGDVVLAILHKDFDELVTLKSLYNNPWERIRFDPQNKKFDSIFVNDYDKVEIRWKLVWVIRNF